MEKSINYCARDFEDIKKELITFSQKYYPELTNDFNDASVGSWLIDLVSAVGDDLNYYIDRCYQENNINSANLRSSILNMARNNGIKLPGPKASMCEVQFSCKLPVDTTNISQPDWSYAPVIKMGSVIGNTNYEFETTEDINFAHQFNDEGISNRTFTPTKNNSGVITGYTVAKTTVVQGGSSRIYKKVLTETEVEPFMEIILPEKNILNVESVIFKESTNFKYNPSNYEFFIDEEEFMVQNETISTYRYFEVNSLAEQYRFGTETRYASNANGDLFVADEFNAQVYDDYTETISGVTRTSRYFKGKWMPITQKFISEQTDAGYTKLIFGGASVVQETPASATTYGEYIASKIINNDMLGVLPKVGWTMYVLYRVGGGASSNLAQNSIKTLVDIKHEFTSINAVNANKKNDVIKSLAVTNISPSIGGKDAPSVEELKYLIKYTTNAQNRCVTLKDYKTKILNIPPKYGCPFRCGVIEENNKIVIPVLGLNCVGKLDSSLPQTMVNNIIEYLSQYKSLTDYVEIKSGKIYHLAFEADIFIDKNYTTADVISSIIAKIKDYMSVSTHDIGQDIFIGDLEREINQTDGVISLIELRVYNIWGSTGGGYSKDKCPLPKYLDYNSSCNPTETEYFKTPEGASSFRIGLNQTDGVLYSDYDSMFEILNPNSDIVVRCKLK